MTLGDIKSEKGDARNHKSCEKHDCQKVQGFAIFSKISVAQGLLQAHV
jgi:hypothetical protein